MTPHVRSFVLFIAGWCGISLLVFLFLADFFTGWSGRAVSVRDVGGEQTMLEVLVVENDGSRFERAWPREAVVDLNLGIDRRALPPKPLPKGLPRTNKDPFTLSFTLEPEGGGVRTVATTGPQPMAIALLFFFLGTLIRNMIVAGSPFSLVRPEATESTTAAPPTPPVAGPSKKGRAKKGPPPSKKRRGGGRRR
jgi:hypothetical protein